MRRLFRFVALCLALALAVPAMADKAGSFYNKGKDAEARQDYEAAYGFYKQAYDLKPKDLAYRASYERMKFLAGASHVHRGQILREQGKLDEALAEFQKAAMIDPSSPIAQQEVRRTQEEIERRQSGQQAPPPQATSQLRQRIEQAQGLIELTPVSDQPITLRLTEDSKVVYETIGKLAGVNVLFDPDYTSRRIHIELNGVSLIDALELVAMESKTFWRPVTSNTIFVAADTPAKRKELEQNIIKTFYLSNLSQPTELQDVVNTLRTILEVSRITQMPSQGAIIIRGTPDQVALAEKLIGDLDKARPEVVVEVAVMQVTREKIRNLGISPPTSASVALNGNINTTSNNNNTTGGTNTTSNTINLNRIGNLTAKDFLVTIPGASATALFSDSNTKLIQNPQIRALDGQKASLKIGDRVPVATGSFGAGIGGVGLNSLVNTQFQYIDVGVNIDITPKVHQNREVTLKLSMDISQVTGQTDIGGIAQPTIGQRKIEHEIRLKEGEVNLLGGLFEDSDVKSLSGLPWVSQVPLLRYLFSTEKVDRRRNELVFVLIPHIVRAQDLTSLNMRPLDVGTGNVIDLRMGTKPKPAAAPAAAPQAPAAQPQQPAAQPPAQQVVPQQPTPAPSSAALQLEVTAPNPPVGSTFSVNVNILNGQNVYSVPVQMTYDPSKLQLVNVSNGNFLSQGGQAVALAHRDGDGNGTLQVTAERPPNSGGASGSGTVFTLTFVAKAPGDAALNITRAGVKDAMMNSIPVSTAQARINIKP